MTDWRDEFTWDQINDLFPSESFYSEKVAADLGLTEAQVQELYSYWVPVEPQDTMDKELFFVCNNDFEAVSCGTEQECRQVMREDQRLIPEYVMRDNIGLEWHHQLIDSLIEEYRSKQVI